MIKKTLLLHSCCAPCCGYVIQLLSDIYRVIPFFYNPNIAPFNEYGKRLNEILKYCRLKGIDMISGEYESGKWTRLVKSSRFMGERSIRCEICIETRLVNAFEFAHKNNFAAVATTLSVSPHKDSGMINKIGSSLESKFGIPFITADFKKNDGFKKSLEVSKEFDFYRQHYCGCIYSKLERDKNSLWYKKYLCKD